MHDFVLQQRKATLGTNEPVSLFASSCSFPCFFTIADNMTIDGGRLPISDEAPHINYLQRGPLHCLLTKTRCPVAVVA